MARDFQVNGESLVLVRFGGHITSGHISVSGVVAVSDNSSLFELGLAAEEVRVTPRYWHRDVGVDNFGPNIPADVMAFLADVRVRVPLIHYDRQVLTACLAESLGGIRDLRFGQAGFSLAPAGSLLGGGVEQFASGYHYMGLTILSPVLNRPWRFPAAYLEDRPIELTLGTGASVAVTSWRAIPYSPYPTTRLSLTAGPVIDGLPTVASGRIALWDHKADSLVLTGGGVSGQGA